LDLLIQDKPQKQPMKVLTWVNLHFVSCIWKQGMWVKANLANSSQHLIAGRAQILSDSLNSKPVPGH